MYSKYLIQPYNFDIAWDLFPEESNDKHTVFFIVPNKTTWAWIHKKEISVQFSQEGTIG